MTFTDNNKQPLAGLKSSTKAPPSAAPVESTGKCSSRISGFTLTDLEKLAKLDNLRPKEAAAYLGVSLSKLARFRVKKNQHLGPNFVKIAGCVIYRRADLDAWLKVNSVSTDAEA